MEIRKKNARFRISNFGFRIWRHGMPQPLGFSWIEKPLLAAMARPEGPEDLDWLRQQGIELLISLT
jgi:hypothetical protein